jgi:hypothetical protein
VLNSGPPAELVPSRQLGRIRDFLGVHGVSASPHDRGVGCLNVTRIRAIAAVIGRITFRRFPPGRAFSRELMLGKPESTQRFAATEVSAAATGGMRGLIRTEVAGQAPPDYG